MRHVDVRELEADLRTLQVEITESTDVREREFLRRCYLTDLQVYRLHGGDLPRFRQYMEWYKNEAKQ